MFHTTEISTLSELLDELTSSRLRHDQELIQRAYEFADSRLPNKVRKSGQPMIAHALTVAAYMVRLNLDTTSVISAMLHETIEQNVATLDEVDKEFGNEVAFIIDGLTNLKNQTAAFTNHNEDPQNFRKLILSATEDIRILIIRLANKLHNVLSLDALAPDRQLNQAKKITLVYAPLCEYLGLGYFQQVFENESFKILEPEIHSQITEYISDLRARSDGVLAELLEQISSMGRQHNLSAMQTKFRTKSIYSTYKKVKRKYMSVGEEFNVQMLDNVKDLMGIRIIVDSVENCYLLLGLLHGALGYEPDEFDDYIVSPKPSGYRSIHTVVNYKSFSVEIQIRTQEMDEFNEFGPASHIAYKLAGPGGFKGSKEMTWTKDLMDWQRKEDLTSNVYKIKAFSESIFVFTPKGKVIQLPKGSSPIDFAYHIHTGMADRYIGAKVNNKMVPMSHELQTGDIVEIVTGKQPNVNRDWLKYAKSNSAKAHIRKHLRGQS